MGWGRGDGETTPQYSTVSTVRTVPHAWLTVPNKNLDSLSLIDPLYSPIGTESGFWYLSHVKPILRHAGPGGKGGDPEDSKYFFCPLLACLVEGGQVWGGVIIIQVGEVIVECEAVMGV